MNLVLKQKWDDYLSAENDGIRSVYLKKLSDFTDTILSLSEDIKKQWVYDISHNYIDKKSSLPIRMPLFEKVVLPILYKGYQEDEKGCARWLAGFSTLIYHSKLAQSFFKVGYNKYSFLEKAIALDSKDELAKHELFKLMASRLDYTIHEVPWGVLWDNNGANINNCEELKSELAEFIELAEILGMKEKYQELIEDCDIHFNHYQTYLINKSDYKSYESYLIQNNISY